MPARPKDSRFGEHSKKAHYAALELPVYFALTADPGRETQSSGAQHRLPATHVC